MHLKMLQRMYNFGEAAIYKFKLRFQTKSFMRKHENRKFYSPERLERSMSYISVGIFGLFVFF